MFILSDSTASFDHDKLSQTNTTLSELAHMVNIMYMMRDDLEYFGFVEYACELPFDVCIFNELRNCLFEYEDLFMKDGKAIPSEEPESTTKIDTHSGCWVGEVSGLTVSFTEKNA